MKPEHQRIAIGEACGRVSFAGLEPDDEHSKRERFTGEYLPDYLNDLNAMQAALKSQTQEFRAEFDRLLHAMAEDQHLLITELEAKDWADCFISCEALLPTAGK